MAYSTPYICPKCCAQPKGYYGFLVAEGADVPPCPNCKTALLPARSLGREGLKAPAR